MTFCLPQDDKSINRKVDLKIIKEKPVVVPTNPSLGYIFSKVYFYLYIRLTSLIKKCHYI